jgi:hypothetical protein
MLNWPDTLTMERDPSSSVILQAKEKEDAMKKLLISLAAAATVLTAAPAFSQVGFYAGDRGIGIEVGRDRDHWRGDRWNRGRHYGWYRGDDCREVTVRRRLPDGSVVVRRVERC